MGELLGVTGFLKRLRQEFPNARIFLSTSTVSGHTLAQEKLTAFTDGVFYIPLDYVWAVRRVLRTLQPSLVLIAETEVWPNLFHEVKRTGAALAIVNGRISDRALPRYHAFAALFRAVLPAADCILVQSEPMRARFISLGATAGCVRVTGNFKYDFEALPAPADSPVAALLQRLKPAQVWIAASTMPPAAPDDVDELDAVLESFLQLSRRFPELLLILAPRKPEQFGDAAARLASAGIPHLRRSRLDASESLPLPGVLLLDSIGELASLFYAADVVFMGGTLARRGGHNILEPAFFSKPVVVGPHMENFQSIAETFRQACACIEIRSAAELAESVERLFGSPETAAAIGRRALACAESERGATGRAVELAHELYTHHLPHYRPAQPWLVLGWPLERLWIWGASRRMRHALANQCRLSVPVISVGNITMGGTGKTPCVLRLATELHNGGHAPAILTRGYGRTSPERQLALPPGASVPARRTGDEPQLFLRSGLAAIGIGADRCATGKLLESLCGVDVHILDDGFQHLRLGRTIDIVLIDALNPFGGGRVFPLGRLREPLSGLARADIVLITRHHFSDLSQAIECHLRQWNPRASVYRARVEPRAWAEHPRGTSHPLSHPPFQRVAGFCGLGNPQAFRRTLESAGVNIVAWHEFGDHHRYLPRELKRVRAQAQANGADALVTTGKDAVNLCDGTRDVLSPLPLFVLEIELAIENHAAFTAEILSRLGYNGSSPHITEQQNG